MQEFVNCLKKNLELFHPRGMTFLLLEQHGGRIVVTAGTVKMMPYLDDSDELDPNTTIQVKPYKHSINISQQLLLSTTLVHEESTQETNELYW